MLKACLNTWQVTRKEQTCELFYTSVRHLTPEQANAKCATAPIKAQLKQLRNAAPAHGHSPALWGKPFLLSALTVEIGSHFGESRAAPICCKTGRHTRRSMQPRSGE